MKMLMNTSKGATKGLLKVEIPELGKSIGGKVRDNWVIEKNNSKYRLMISTDRQSVNAKYVCAIPGKGQILNLISAYWFDLTRNIVPNHQIVVLHPNVLLAKQAKTVIPIEVVVRRYMAKSQTPTSVYFNYFVKGRRNIYGIKFPEGLKENEEFPMGTIVTPTTKAVNGYDKELTDNQAQRIVDSQVGIGIWDAVKNIACKVFEKSRLHCSEKGIILADTKFEFGIDEDGNIMLVDEILTPECSRFWIAKTYKERINKRKDPEPNKDALLEGLLKEGAIKRNHNCKVSSRIVESMSEMHVLFYKMLIGDGLPIPVSDPAIIKNTVLNYLVANNFHFS